MVFAFHSVKAAWRHVQISKNWRHFLLSGTLFAKPGLALFILYILLEIHFFREAFPDFSAVHITLSQREYITFYSKLPLHLWYRTALIILYFLDAFTCIFSINNCEFLRIRSTSYAFRTLILTFSPVWIKLLKYKILHQE